MGTSTRLHDANTTVQLALSVVVDVGVVSGGRGCRQAAAVARATVLDEDVGALLTSCSLCVGQRRLTASVTTLHIHTVLRNREKYF